MIRNFDPEKIVYTISVVEERLAEFDALLANMLNDIAELQRHVNSLIGVAGIGDAQVTGITVDAQELQAKDVGEFHD